MQPTIPTENASLIQILSLLLSSGGVLYLLGRGVYNWWTNRLKAQADVVQLQLKDTQDQLDLQIKEKEDELARKRVEETAREEARKVLQDQGLQRIQDLEQRALTADKRYDQMLDTQHQRGLAFDVLKAQYDRLEETNKTLTRQINELQQQLTDLRTKLTGKDQTILSLQQELTRLQAALDECLSGKT